METRIGLCCYINRFALQEDIFIVGFINCENSNPIIVMSDNPVRGNQKYLFQLSPSIPHDINSPGANMCQVHTQTYTLFLKAISFGLLQHLAAGIFSHPMQQHVKKKYQYNLPELSFACPVNMSRTTSTHGSHSGSLSVMFSIHFYILLKSKLTIRWIPGCSWPASPTCLSLITADKDIDGRQ